MTGILRTPRRAALAAITALGASASLVSFAESYRALYLWAADAESAARAALAASAAASNPISQRQLMTRFGLTRAAATRVRQAVLAEANGHVPASDPYSDARPGAAGQRTGVSPDATGRGAHP